MKKGQRPKGRKVVFLVEGKSDQNALEYGISSLYDMFDSSIDVSFIQMQDCDQTGGDITSKNGVKPDNIERLISKLFIEPFLWDYGLYPKDLLEVIQIVDMDAAYIGDECIFYKDTDLTEYQDDGIYTRNPEGIIVRNQRKRDNLEVLTSLDRIKISSKSIPYSVYYFSCNMDHFISGERNMNAWYKTTVASEFSKKCRTSNTAFNDRFFNNKNVVTEFDYKRSWEFIREGSHSLEPYSNLCLLLSRLSDR